MKKYIISSVMFVASITMGIYVSASYKESDFQQDLKSPGIINGTELATGNDTLIYSDYSQGGTARPMVDIK